MSVAERSGVIAGTRFFAEMLQAYRTSHVFMVPTVLLRGMAELQSVGITPISAHGEKAAAYMADGYARVSNRPGICLAQSVGAANLAAGLKDAYMANAPVIAITGGPNASNRHRHVYQEAHDAEMFRAVTKWAASIESAVRIPELLRQAFREATSGAPGPVYLEASGNWGQVFDEPCARELIVEPRFDETPAFRPEPELEAVHEAIVVLEQAERPLIVAGGGVIRSGAEAELMALAEQLSIPVVTSLNAKAALPEDHPLSLGVVGTYARRSAADALKAADVVFFIGSKAGGMVTVNWTIPTIGTTVLHLDIEPSELGRVYPTRVALQGDARAGLMRMLAHAEPQRRPSWVHQVQEAKRTWRAAVTDELLQQTPIRPERICRELSDALPDNAVVVADTLQAGLWAGVYMELRSPRQSFIRCAGSLGWGLPASLGAKCAAGDRPVICVTGDGGLYYHLSELETARRHGIGVVVVVNNNGSYAGEQRMWTNAYEDTDGGADQMWRFGDRDFASIARELGCTGIRVQTPGEIAPAIDRALADGGPVVLDVVSDPTALADHGHN
jgi:acetolactate synthase-1/2/3 large subunit